MRKETLVALAFLGTTLLAGAQERILFIGNSYTGYNNLGTMVENAAASMGYSFSTTSLTPGGATLYQHTQNQSTYNQMAAASWNYVVFQAQSQEPSFPNSQVSVQTLPYADQLVDSLRSIAPCAQPTFFRTWGRKYGDAANCPFFPPLCTYEGMDSLLHLRYRMMADSNDAYLSPVGSVWKYIRNTDTTIELYTSDHSHPSLAGSYAAACTFTTIFTRSNPLAITYEANLDSTVAYTIRQAAKLVVYDSLSHWNVGAFDVDASLAHQMSNDTLYFNSNSNHYDSLWTSFGDGSGSDQNSGSHSYGLDQSFTVRHYAYKCGRVDSVSFTVQSVVPFGLEESSISTDRFYELLHFWNPELARINLYNAQGKRVASYYQPSTLPTHLNGLHIAELEWHSGRSQQLKLVLLPR